MKKIQPKIFIDTEVSLESGYTLETGYAIGQTIHFNDTGNEYYHSLNGVWKPVGGSASKENTANKQNSLTVDGTGVKFPTVDAVNAGLSAKQTLPISLTYSALYALKQANTLVVGQRYIISDYQTVHEIPNSGTWDEQNQVMSTNVINTGQVEPLLVTAISVNELAPEAYSALFPDDVIYYSPTNDQTMVAGCTKGYIYRRIDTKQNNDIGFDYRNVKFRRYQIDVTTEHADGNATYLKRAVVKKTGTVEVYIKLSDANGLFSDASKWKRFEWDNLMYISPIGFNEDYSKYGWVLNDSQFQLKIPTTSNYNDYYFFSTEPTINGVQSSYDDIYQNKFKQDKSSLIFNSNSVFFGNNFNRNTVGNYFNNNTVGNYFYNNTVESYFNGNTVGNYFNNNTVGNYFYSNTVGSYFNGNTVGDRFQINTVGIGFNNNTVGDGFQINTVGNNFYNNFIGASFNYNSIGAYFNNNSTSANMSKDLSAVTELYSKQYPHELIATDNNGVTIKWYDKFGDICIISLD